MLPLFFASSVEKKALNMLEDGLKTATDYISSSAYTQFAWNLYVGLTSLIQELQVQFESRIANHHFLRQNRQKPESRHAMLWVFQPTLGTKSSIGPAPGDPRLRELVGIGHEGFAVRQVADATRHLFQGVQGHIHFQDLGGSAWTFWKKWSTTWEVLQSLQVVGIFGMFPWFSVRFQWSFAMFIKNPLPIMFVEFSGGSLFFAKKKRQPARPAWNQNLQAEWLGIAPTTSPPRRPLGSRRPNPATPPTWEAWSLLKHSTGSHFRHHCFFPQNLHPFPKECVPGYSPWFDKFKVPVSAQRWYARRTLAAAASPPTPARKKFSLRWRRDMGRKAVVPEWVPKDFPCFFPKN